MISSIKSIGKDDELVKRDQVFVAFKRQSIILLNYTFRNVVREGTTKILVD